MTAISSVVAAPLDTTSIERPNRMSAPVRVFQVATGNVGSEMIKRLGNRTDLELVGLHCYSPEKIGRDSGEIVGSFSNNTGEHGFVQNGGSFTAINVPGATTTVALGINDSGAIVGSYTNSSGEFGFLDLNASFTTLSCPGAVGSDANSINSAGQVAGDCSINGKENGFFYSGGAFTLIDVPGFNSTTAFGINDHDEIVGSTSQPVNEPASLSMLLGGLLSLAALSLLKRKIFV